MKARLVPTSCAAALFLAVAANLAMAQDLGRVSPEEGATVRLIASGPQRDAVVAAAVEIRLQPGWKTYWTNPGPVGFVPRFDWSASENLASAEVLWPAPRRFDEGGSQSIGYSASVLLPVRVVAKDPAAPVRLNLSFDYGACADLCVPSHADVALQMPAKAPDALTAARVSGFSARVPVPTETGGGADLALVSATRTAPDLLEVTVRTPEAAQMVDLLPQTPADLVAGLPILVKTGPDGTRIYHLKLRPRSAPAVLHLVAVADARAISVPVSLDAGVPSP
jgi:DsbC/DsbD-like thiol-disulfide interchange protein